MSERDTGERDISGFGPPTGSQPAPKRAIGPKRSPARP